MNTCGTVGLVVQEPLTLFKPDPERGKGRREGAGGHQCSLSPPSTSSGWGREDVLGLRSVLLMIY